MCHHNTPVVLLIEVTAVEVADVAGVVIIIVVTLVTAVAGTLRSDKRTTESCTSIYLHVATIQLPSRISSEIDTIVASESLKSSAYIHYDDAGKEISSKLATDLVT